MPQSNTQYQSVTLYIVTNFSGNYIHFQLKMLYGNRVSVFTVARNHPMSLSTCHLGSSRMPKFDSIENITNTNTKISWNQLHTTCDEIISKITLSIGCLLLSLTKRISNCMTVILVPTWHDQWQKYLYIVSTYTTVATDHSRAFRCLTRPSADGGH